MLTSMEGERVKGSPKERTEIGHQKITRSKAEIQAAQDGPMLVENLVGNLAKRVERDPLYTATTRILEVEARADPTNPTPIPTLPTPKAKEVRGMVVESHLVVVDVEKESMPLKHEKNGLTKDKYRTCSRMSKKNGNREANLTQIPTLVLSGREQSPSG